MTNISWNPWQEYDKRAVPARLRMFFAVLNKRTAAVKALLEGGALLEVPGQHWTSIGRTRTATKIHPHSWQLGALTEVVNNWHHTCMSVSPAEVLPVLQEARICWTRGSQEDRSLNGTYIAKLRNSGRFRSAWGFISRLNPICMIHIILKQHDFRQRNVVCKYSTNSSFSLGLWVYHAVHGLAKNNSTFHKQGLHLKKTIATNLEHIVQSCTIIHNPICCSKKIAYIVNLKYWFRLTRALCSIKKRLTLQSEQKLLSKTITFSPKSRTLSGKADKVDSHRNSISKERLNPLPTKLYVTPTNNYSAVLSRTWSLNKSN